MEWNEHLACLIFNVCIVDSDYKRVDDAISVASQLGRLDYLNTLLTIFGIFLAVFALFGAWIISTRATAIARETAEKEAVREVNKRLDDWIEARKIEGNRKPIAEASTNVEITEKPPEGSNE